MTKINIVSGFLGAGKTTFIKRLIGEVFAGEKLVLIENEFGEIGVDGGFLQDAGIEITEMNSGCICCSLVGDFTKALKETVETYRPDRILIEPSGVGKLSDVIAAVENTGDETIHVDACITVADVTKCKMYRKNFGEFYEDQIRYADSILFTRTDKANQAKIEQAVAIVREINGEANLITTPLALLGKEQIADALTPCTMAQELMEKALQAHHDHEHHHHDDHCDCHDHHHHDDHCDCHDHDHHHHDDHCDCHEHDHHHHDDHCDCHDHDHHHHDEHCDCHEHGHHHHDEHCDCHDHDHHHHDEHCDCHEHHHHHHADETFTSWGFETVKTYTAEEIEAILTALDGGEYGVILRAKGMVSSGDRWTYFDYVPGEHGIREGSACFTGKICVIGASLDEMKLAALFGKAL